MSKNELITFVAQELAKVEGGWQHLELRIAKSTHAAKHLVEELIQAGHVKVTEEESK